VDILSLALTVYLSLVGNALYPGVQARSVLLISESSTTQMKNPTTHTAVVSICDAVNLIPADLSWPLQANTTNYRISDREKTEQLDGEAIPACMVTSKAIKRGIPPTSHAILMLCLRLTPSVKPVLCDAFIASCSTCM